MKLIYTFLFLSFLHISFMPNCNKAEIKKTWLTSKRQFAGIIRMNEDGTKSKGSWMTHTIYVELTNDNTVTFDSIKYDNKIYQINYSIFNNTDFIVGKKLTDSSNVIVKPKNNRIIKQLNIPNLDIEFEENKKYEFIIYCTKDGKLIEQKSKVSNTNLLYDLTM